MNFAGDTRLKDYISMKKFFNIIPGKDACCILLYGDIGEYDSVRSGDIARELLEAEALSGKCVSTATAARCMRASPFSTP